MNLFRQRHQHIIVWVSLILIGMLVFGLSFPLWIVATHAVINIGLLAVLFYAGGAIIHHFYEKGKWTQTIIYEILLYISICYPRIFVNMYLAHQYSQTIGQDSLFTLFWRVTALVMATSAFVLVLGISFALLKNRIKQEEKTKALLAEQQAAQLDFLKAQINPHFLFNALNNIYSLVELKSPDAPRMLLKLSELLRYVIYDGRQKTVLLSKEIIHIQNFIQLFQMRSEKAANIVLENGSLPPLLEIEPMILIPLVENCFKHADFDLNPAAFARISVDVKYNALHFATENTYEQNDHQKDTIGGVGLDNIKRRLQLRYPDHFQFTYYGENGIFHTKLTIQYT